MATLQMRGNVLRNSPRVVFEVELTVSAQFNQEMTRLALISLLDITVDDLNDYDDASADDDDDYSANYNPTSTIEYSVGYWYDNASASHYISLVIHDYRFDCDAQSIGQPLQDRFIAIVSAIESTPHNQQLVMQFTTGQ